MEVKYIICMIRQEEPNLRNKNQIFNLMDVVSSTFTIICDGGGGYVYLV